MSKVKKTAEMVAAEQTLKATATAAVEGKTFRAGEFSIIVTPETTLAPSDIRKAVKLHGLTGADASKAVKDFLAFQRVNFGKALVARNSKVGKLITLAGSKNWVVAARMTSNGRSFTLRADYTGSGSITPRTVAEITAALNSLNSQA